MKKIEREIVLIVIYVDDLIITGDSDVDVRDVKEVPKKNEVTKHKKVTTSSPSILASYPRYPYL